MPTSFLSNVLNGLLLSSLRVCPVNIGTSSPTEIIPSALSNTVKLGAEIIFEFEVCCSAFKTTAQSFHTPPKTKPLADPSVAAATPLSPLFNASAPT